MPLFVTVSEGPRADQARPVLATADQRLVGELLKAIGRMGEACEVTDQAEHPPAPLRPIGAKRDRELAVTR